jgi:hypothetical protein
MIYARVLVGGAYTTTPTMKESHTPPTKDEFAVSGAAGAPRFDSVIAEAGADTSQAQAYKEYVMYDHTHMYPEFIVYYKF